MSSPKLCVSELFHPRIMQSLLPRHAFINTRSWRYKKINNKEQKTCLLLKTEQKLSRIFTNNSKVLLQPVVNILKLHFGADRFFFFFFIEQVDCFLTYLSPLGNPRSRWVFCFLRWRRKKKKHTRTRFFFFAARASELQRCARGSFPPRAHHREASRGDVTLPARRVSK